MKENNGFKLSINIGTVVALIISMVIIYISATIPGVSELSMLIPIALGYILLKEGITWFITSFFWIGVFAFMFPLNMWMLTAGIFTIVLAPAIHMVFGVRNKIYAKSPEEAILITIENEMTSPWRGVLIFCMATAIGVMGTLLSMQAVTGISPQSYYEQSIDAMISVTKSEIEAQKTSLPQDPQSQAKINEALSGFEAEFTQMKSNFPSVIFTISIIYGLGIYFIARRVYKRLKINVPRNARLIDLRFPENAMNGVLVIMLVFLIAKWTGIIQDESAFFNVIFMIFIMFSFLGAGATMRVASKFHFGKAIGYISIGMMVLFTGPTLPGIIGIISAVKRSFDADRSV